ncbi:MAG: response regulator, partial [Spirochaetales bacterium]|nr:response regulator [Spirochaetales bacterium]
MSHELRTPLNAILGFSQLLDLKKENLNNEQVEFLGYVKSSSYHLLEMVNDILDISKIESGRFEIERKPFNLSQMLTRLPMTVTSLAFKKKINLLVDIDLTNEVIEADEVRLKQVLYNLLYNAIKFTDSGKNIGIRAISNDNEAVIEVWDEGKGIDEKDMEKVFDPFEQVGQTKPQGTGLGLAISRKLIELHGGTLTAYSKIGEGSHFIVHIPGIIQQGSKEIEQKKVESYVEKTPLGKESNILVVEDNVTNQKVIEAALKRLGYQVQIEESGREGINAAKKNEFDLILMDIQLPGLDGVETMKLIRKEGKKEIPIVAITAYAMKGDMEKFISEGFDGYISKPIVIEKLKETLETLARVVV